MAKFTAIALAAVAFHCAFAAPNAAPKPEGVPPAETTGDAANIFVKLLKDVTAEVQKFVPDSKQVVENVSKTSQELATNLESIVTKWKAEADKHKGEFSEAAEGVVSKIKGAIDDLQKLATPPAGSRAADVKAKFDSNFKELVDFGDKLKDDFKPHFEKAQENIAAFGKFISDGFWSFGKSVQSHVENFSKPDPQQHK